jgi:very-short-patch-repair endonuclease
MDVQDDLDRRMATIADRQQGVLRRRDLVDLGLSRTQIADRIAKRRLRPMYRGVYALGHRQLRREGFWLAAVWACGEGAVLSHWDAAALHDLLPPRGARIHVIRPSNAGRSPDSARIALHRVGTFQPWEGRLIDGIPATTVARTLLDLAPKLRPRALEDLIARADRLRTIDLRAVHHSLQAHPRQPGAPRLRSVVDALSHRAAADLRSPLETKLLQLCDDHNLPTPRANATIQGLLVDFHWPGTNLIVETDGYAYHSTPSSFERDRERDQQLTLAGYTVVRFTYNQVTRTPEAVADRLRRLLR